MKIARMTFHPVALPLSRPYEWPHGVQRGLDALVVRVEASTGELGYGEAVVLPTEQALSQFEAIGEALAGRRLDEVAAIRDAALVALSEAAAEPPATAAAGAIESACWDALGHALGVPSRVFFGGAVRDAIDLYGFVSGHDDETLAVEAEELRGRRAIYMKIAGRENHEQAVALVRQAIGPDVLLRIDCNEVWNDAETAAERIGALIHHNIDWVEQPVARADVPGLAELRGSVGVQIAADEALEPPGGLSRVLEQRAADVVLQDAHRAGGLLRLREHAARCEAAGVLLSLHAPFQSDISFCAQMQVAATIPNLTLGNQTMHHLLAEQLTDCGGPASVSDGLHQLTAAAGHGFKLDTSALDNATRRWRIDGPYGIDQR